MKLKPLANPRKLADVEREYFLRALYTLGFNRKLTARTLGISVRTVRNKIHEYRREVFPTTAGEFEAAMQMSAQPER